MGVSGVKTIYIVRHCKAEGQDQHAPLTIEGEKQAEELVAFLAPMEVEAIICSPFLRARQSIQPLANKLNIHISIDHRLSERVLSTVQMPDWLECLRDTYDDMDLAFQGGESNREAMSRGVAVVQDMIKSNTQHAVLATHGGLMSMLLKYFDHRFGFDEWQGLSNPDVYRVLYDDKGETKLERIWT
jgi:2,3-bisphosphoglycerate-dependent phosphoglycerate mutase